MEIEFTEGTESSAAARPHGQQFHWNSPEGWWVQFGLSLALIGAGLAVFFSAYRRMKLQRQIADTPTSKARSAPMGKVELKGLVETDPAVLKGLTAPFSGKPCVWCRFKVEEEVEHHDSKGSHKSWETRQDSTIFLPFMLRDATGTVKVLPEGAEVQSPQLFTFTSGGWFNKSLPLGPGANAWLGRYNRVRFSEWRLETGFPLYALGVHRAIRQAEGGDLESCLAQGQHGETFLLSAWAEEELLSRLKHSVLIRMILGSLLTTGGLSWLLEKLVG